MARPKTAAPRTEKVQFRTTLAELVAMKEAAERAGLSLNEYARQVTHAAAATKPGKKPRQPAKPLAPKVITVVEPYRLEPATYHQIRLLGVNLNQMVHRLNALGLPPPPELSPLLGDVRRILAGHFGGSSAGGRRP